MTEYQGYPEYKDSGVEWLGQIPSTWEVSQIRRVTECCDYLRIPVNSGDRMDMKGDIPYWGANSIQGYVNKALVDFPAILVGEDGAPFMDKSKEVSFAIDYPFWPNNHVHVLKAKTGVNYEYISRALNVVDYSSYIKGSTRQKLNQGDLMGIRIPLPSLETQHAIVKFLKRETAHIDAGIANMESLIALLTEKRSALISEVITRGIPGEHTEFKDSGVEWVEKIPFEWDALKVGSFFKASKGKTAALLTKEYCANNSGEYPVYSGQTANDGIMGMLNSYEIDAGSEGFLFVTSVGEKAMTSRIVKGKFSLSQNCMVIKPNLDSLLVPYYDYQFQVLFGYERSKIPQDMQPSFRIGDFYGYKFLRPPVEIQRKIVGFLDAETASIDLAISNAKSLIHLMKEKRQVLISDVVTGKIDVTNSTN